MGFELQEKPTFYRDVVKTPSKFSLRIICIPCIINSENIEILFFDRLITIKSVIQITDL